MPMTLPRAFSVLRRQAGFTLVELVVVMVLLGILAVVVLPRLASTNAFGDAAFHAEVVAGLRYAQKSAVSHRRLVCAELTATRLTLRIAASNPAAACGAALLRAPDGAEAFASTTRASMALAAGNLPLTLHFQPDGRISSDVAGTAVWTGTLVIDYMPGISIAGATGYVK